MGLCSSNNKVVKRVKFFPNQLSLWNSAHFDVRCWILLYRTVQIHNWKITYWDDFHGFTSTSFHALSSDWNQNGQEYWHTYNVWIHQCCLGVLNECLCVQLVSKCYLHSWSINDHGWTLQCNVFQKSMIYYINHNRIYERKFMHFMNIL